MVQHIRKKHPNFAPLANAPLTTAVISSAPAVISADGTTAEAVVVRKTDEFTASFVPPGRRVHSRPFPPQTTDLLTQAMTELSQNLTSDYRAAQGDYQRIQYIPVSQAAGSGLSQPQHIQLQVVQVAPVSSPRSYLIFEGCRLICCTTLPELVLKIIKYCRKTAGL